MAKKKSEDTESGNEIKFDKEQILKSSRYSDYRDILSILLEKDKKYSLGEIEITIKEFLNKEVK